MISGRFLPSADWSPPSSCHLFGGLFGGGGTTVSTSQQQDVNVTVNPTINVDVDVPTEPIAQAIEAVGEGQAEQTAALAQAIDAQAMADLDQAMAVKAFGVNVGQGLQGLVVVAGLSLLIFVFRRARKGGR